MEGYTIEHTAVLLAVIISYIIAGTGVNILVGGESFDWKKMLKGIGIAAAACICVLVLAYASTIVNIDGFNANTFIKSAILVYATKLLTRILKLLGITKYNDTEVKEMKDTVDTTELKALLTEVTDVLKNKVSEVTEKATENATTVLDTAADKAVETIEEIKNE